jgi:hypothetical protein
MRILFLVCLGLAACAGSGSADAPVGEPFVTGRECAQASGACEAGRCTVEIDNRCDTPVTCQLRIESQCQTAAGDVGPATAGTKKVTQLKGTRNMLEAQTNCEGTAIATKVDTLECI